jgi:hypothetical protein
LTLGEVEKNAPDAIWRLDISLDAARGAFSHNLGPKRKQEFSVMASENGHSTLNLTSMFAANRCGLHVPVLLPPK